MKRFLSLAITLIMVLSMIPVVSFAAEVRTVYLNPSSGSDSNTGLTATAPVKTLAAAYAALEGAEEGIITLQSKLTLSGVTNFPECDIPVTITSSTISADNHIYLAGDTTLDNITLTLSTSSTTTYISSEGHDLTIGENVTCTNTGAARFCLTTCYGAGSNGDATLTVKAGNWRNIFAAGYKSANTGNVTLNVTGGDVYNLLAPTFSGNLTGNTTMNISGLTGKGSVCVAPNETGTITGDVALNLGDGVTNKIRMIRYYKDATVDGTVTVTIDGDCSAISAIANEGTGTGTIKRTCLVLKSGALSTTPCAFNDVSLEIPSGKNFTLTDCTITADNVTSQGTLTLAGTATLTAKKITGSLSCAISGEVATGHTYLTAPAGSAVTFPESTGVKEENGKWLAAAPVEAEFQGLVVHAEKGVSITLYSEYKSNTGEKQTPTKTVENGNMVSYYYAGASGPYRCVANRSGYYKLTKNIYVSPEEAKTCTEQTILLQPRAGGTATDSWEPANYQEYTDEMLALNAHNTDISQWPEYADVFTTPWHTQDHAAQQMTTQSQAEDFLFGMDTIDDNMYIFSIGKSGEYGYDVWAIFYTETDLSAATTYEEAAALMGQDKPTVMYRAQIHGNEPAAGEAALAMAQRLDGAYGGNLLTKINVVLVPRSSPDGARNFSRTLPSGIDPNRDMLRLESQEISDYVALYQLVQPEMVIDGHEYDGAAGSSYTYDSDITAGAGFSNANTDAYQQTSIAMLQGVFDAVKENGLTYRYYSNQLNSDNANISRPYFGQQGVLSFLLETRGNGTALVNYNRRIITQVVAVSGLLDYFAENADEIQQMVDAEKQNIVENGKTYRDADKIALSTVAVADAGYGFGVNRIYQNGNETIVNVNPGVFTDVQRSRTAPTAYVIPAAATFTQQVLALMDKQGISYTFVPAGATILLQQYTGTATTAALTAEQSVTFGQGAYVFTMNQEKGLTLAMLMEPDVTDLSEQKGTLAQQGIITPVGGSFPIYRYCYDLNAAGFINYTLADAEPAHVTVYLDGTNGSDTNDGLTETAPVKTMEQAYAAMATALQMAGEGSTGKIIISGMYFLGKEAYEFPAVGFPVTITGKTADDGIRYTGKSEADPFNRALGIHGDTTFEYMTIFADSAYTHNFIMANGHNLTMGEGINSICREGKNYQFTLYGGSYYETDIVESTNLVVKSGTWRAIYAGGYNGSVSGTAKLEVSNATAYAGIFSSRMGNVGHVDMTISNTTVTTDGIYAGTQTANSPKKLGFVKEGITITLGENVTAPALYCSAKAYGGIAGGVTLVVKGTDFVKLPLVARYSGLSASYTTDWILVKLGADMPTAITLDPTMELDLAGCDITGDLTVDGTLTVYDSATDDYTVADGLCGEITGTVTGTLVAKDGYIAAANGFHKFGGQYISGVSLRPNNAGIYYTATFLCDEVLAEILETGVAVSLADMPGTDFATDEDTLYTVGTTGVMIQNILTGDAEDADRAIMDIYAASYVVLPDGTVLVSENTVAYSLYDVLCILKTQNPTAFNDFCTTWNIASWF